MKTIICLQPHLVAILALVLLPATGMSQELAPEEELRREWLEIQANSDREARETWWQVVGPEQMTAFIEAGAQISVADNRGWTPLHSAARYNSDPAVLSALLQAGAVVHAKDNSGDTALHWAAAENTNVEIVNRLLDAGANVNARDKYGWLPIHTAADRNSNPEVIEALLMAGAERNKRAYYVFFRPKFLLKHNSNMSEKDKKLALALLQEPD